jgi:hypothetical protein
MVIRPSLAVHLSRELEDFLKKFGPSHKFNKWIEDMKIVLKGNMLAGNRIQKQLIPAHYIRRYGVNNLYRYDHPEGFRSCYVLLKYNGLGVCPLVLDLMTHPEYDKRFGYKTT